MKPEVTLLMFVLWARDALTRNLGNELGEGPPESRGWIDLRGVRRAGAGFLAFEMQCFSQGKVIRP